MSQSSARSMRPVVVGSVWRHRHESTRLKLTYVTRGTVDFLNLTTDGHGVMSRSWLEKHFTEEESARA
jgi:hypothetical protein